MSKRSARKSPAFLQHQVQQRQKDKARRDARANERSIEDAKTKVQDMFKALVNQVATQTGRTQRLAVAYADRCFRVHELMGELRTEWERAEAAEARIAELEAQLVSAQFQDPAKKAAAKKAPAKPRNKDG